MIEQLPLAAYDRVLPLFEPLRYNLVVDSIVAGHTPAWVFVNRAGAPSAALMWNRQDAMLIAGDPHDVAFRRAIGDVIATEIIPDARRRYIPELTLHYDCDAWLDNQGALLGDRTAETAERRYYRFNRPRVDWRAGLPAGFDVQRIDEPLLSDPALGNVEHVAGWIDSYWRSYRKFVETSFGYCLVRKSDDGLSEITSWCLAVYASNGNFELGLATMPDHRRHGHATLVAAAAVEYCAAQKYTPHWHCWSSNAASIATAERVGFTDPTSYDVLRFEI